MILRLLKYFFLLNIFLNAYAENPLSKVPSTVTWEQQAERLQNVSAALLDGFPIAEPLCSDFCLTGKAIVSFLPKVDPSVGGKTEKVPSSPVHAVPTFQIDYSAFKQSNVESGMQVWVGYLPPGGEKLVNIDAKLSQWLTGAAFLTSFGLGEWSLYSSVGFQTSSAEIHGAITAENADDSFYSRTLLFYVAPGIVSKKSGFFMNGFVASKTTSSEFRIEEDYTTLTSEDALSDAKVPFVLQATVGFRGNGGIGLAYSHLWVPDRLLMPRVTTMLGFAF